MSATFATGLKKMFRHSYDTDNFCLVQYVRNQVFVRRIAEDALRQDNPETSARLKKLQAALQEEDLRRLVLVERVCFFNLAGLLVLFPFVSQVVLRQYALPLDRNFRSEGRIGEDYIERTDLDAVSCSMVPVLRRKQAILAEDPAAAVTDDRHVGFGNLCQKRVFVNASKTLTRNIALLPIELHRAPTPLLTL